MTKANDCDGKLSVSCSRRSFLKASAAFASTTALYGCSKNGDSEPIMVGGANSDGITPPEITEMILPGTTAHNCGGRCLTQAHVKNGVIKRFTTDERPDIKIADGDDMQYRACSRCRSYKGRLYHPGRLRYPMMQTGNRGDMSTFKRVTWDVALQNIAKKMVEVRDTYGPQAFYSMYASGSIGWNHGNGMINNVLSAFGGYLTYSNNYSSHQRNYMRDMNGARFRTSRCSIIKTDTIVLWGSHFTNTRNSRHWPMMQAKEEVKRKGGKIYYIGPTMEDSNSSYADEWVPIRPGTDGALALAIMYEMMKGGLLNTAFVQKTIYGFYPCKSYWVNNTTGATDPADPFAATTNADPNKYVNDNAWRLIEEVPVGESLKDYLEGTTYTGMNGTNVAKYPHKAHAKTPKTAAWAAGITGIAEATIKTLATDVYGQSTKKVFTERSYGVQRQYNGIYTYHAIDTLIAVSGQWGTAGTGLDYYSKSFDYNEFNPDYPSVSNPLPSDLNSSPTLWHELATGAKRFGDIDGNLKNNLYKIKFDKVRNQFETDSSGNYVADLDAQNNPIKVTPKIVFNIAGNMLANQHMNIPQVMTWIKDRSIVECIVVFDNFMTSSARYADFVLPADMNWEREDIGWNDDDDEIMIFASKAINPPGDVQSIHFFGRELAKKLDALVPGLNVYDKVTFKNEAFSGGKNMTEEEILKYMWNRGAVKYSFDELKRRGIINVNKEGAERVENSDAMKKFQAGQNLAPSSNFTATKDVGTAKRSGKFHAYARNIVEEFNTRGMKKYSGIAYQSPKILDEEGDPIAFPLPVYIPLDKWFADAGITFKPASSAGKDRTLLLLSTHDKYRSHSTHNENAWLRDLYKQEPTTNGTIKHVSDFNTYANMPADPGKFEETLGTISRIGGTGLAPLYINKKDAELRGIKNGQKIKVYNEIGNVYASAFITDKVIPGVVILFQGSWYDPDADGTDVGGNPNTLTPDIPSYVDHGNAQNAIAVQVVTA